jgi:hypothetical protein
MNHTENTISIVIVQQSLDRYIRIRCRGNTFIEQLISDSPGIVDAFTGRYQAMAAVQRVTAQQRVYTPQYF